MRLPRRSRFHCSSWLHLGSQRANSRAPHEGHLLTREEPHEDSVGRRDGSSIARRRSPVGRVTLNCSYRPLIEVTAS